MIVCCESCNKPFMVGSPETSRSVLNGGKRTAPDQQQDQGPWHVLLGLRDIVGNRCLYVCWASQHLFVQCAEDGGDNIDLAMAELVKSPTVDRQTAKRSFGFTNSFSRGNNGFTIRLVGGCYPRLCFDSLVWVSAYVRGHD